MALRWSSLYSLLLPAAISLPAQTKMAEGGPYVWRSPPTRVQRLGVIALVPKVLVVHKVA